MAKVKGSAGVVKVGINTVAGVRSFSLDESMTPIEDSDLGTHELTYVTGDITRTGSVECFWDKADTTGQEALVIGASVSLVLSPDNVRTQTMTALITSVGQANEKQNMVTKNVGFTVTGTVTVA